jgi:hypothetical protein
MSAVFAFFPNSPTSFPYGSPALPKSLLFGTLFKAQETILSYYNITQKSRKLTGFSRDLERVFQKCALHQKVNLLVHFL